MKEKDNTELLAQIKLRDDQQEEATAVADRTALLRCLEEYKQQVGAEMQAIYDSAIGGTTVGLASRMTLELLSTNCSIMIRRCDMAAQPKS